MSALEACVVKLAGLLLERFGPMNDLEAERFLAVWAGGKTRP